MSERFDKMERCARLAGKSDDSSLHELFDLLADKEWRVRYAAAVALGDRKDRRAVGPLVAALRAEDAAPLFSQKDDIGGCPAGYPFAFELKFPDGMTAETRAAWERRGRVKQVACLALGAIGAADAAAVERLHSYATDQTHDPEVRAAAAKALGLIGDPSSKPVLEKAANDFEWCTKTEAAKGLAKVTLHDH